MNGNGQKLEFGFDIELSSKTYQSGKRVTCKHGYPVFYEDSELKALRETYTWLLKKYKPRQPFIGAVRLTVKYGFPMIKGKYHGAPKTTKPDTDNLQKLIKDCMTEVGFWKDDAQVYSETIEKYYSNHSGIRIILEEVRELHDEKCK